MSEIAKFINLCKLSQKKMKLHLAAVLSDYYEIVVYEDGFIYAKGTDPVLLTAHMDTVHTISVQKAKIKKKKGKTIISSPQGIGGDDRCGIYMILNILETTDYRPSILFCEDEEIGGIGSNKFCKTEYAEDLKTLKFFAELDRANANDAVFYDCGNKDFQTFVCETTDFKENFGSFSDISHLSPATDVASVNLSCGYYKQHTLDEYVVFEEMENAIQATIKLIEAANDVEQFDYQEVRYAGSYSPFSEMMYGMEIDFKYGDKDEWDYVDGGNESECLASFFVNHPDVCYNDILDMQAYYYDSPLERYGGFYY